MPVKRKDRNGKIVIYGRVRTPGEKTKEKSCKTWKEALEWEKLVKATRQDINLIATDSLTMETLIELHLDQVLARGLSEKTYNEKRKCFRQLFMDIKPNTPVVQVKYGAIEAHLNKLAIKVSGHRANKYRQHIVRAYNWGIRALGLPEPNPWRVERYKEIKRPRRMPTIEEFWQVYDAATEREKRLLLTFLHTAGRRNEVFSIKKDDVDFENGRIRLWTKKRMGGLEPDWLPMTEELEEVLKEQRLEAPFNENVFVNPDTGLPWAEHGRLLPRLCKKAGVEPFGYHAIRHLSASILDDKGFPLSAIQAILRHKSSHTTARYLHSLRGAKVELGEAFSRKGKKSEVLAFKKGGEG